MRIKLFLLSLIVFSATLLLHIYTQQGKPKKPIIIPKENSPPNYTAQIRSQGQAVIVATTTTQTTLTTGSGGGEEEEEEEEEEKEKLGISTPPQVQQLPNLVQLPQIPIKTLNPPPSQSPMQGIQDALNMLQKVIKGKSGKPVKELSIVEKCKDVDQGGKCDSQSSLEELLAYPGFACIINLQRKLANDRHITLEEAMKLPEVQEKKKKLLELVRFCESCHDGVMGNVGASASSAQQSAQQKGQVYEYEYELQKLADVKNSCGTDSDCYNGVVGLVPLCNSNNKPDYATTEDKKMACLKPINLNELRAPLNLPASSTFTMEGNDNRLAFFPSGAAYIKFYNRLMKWLNDNPYEILLPADLVEECKEKRESLKSDILAFKDLMTNLKNCLALKDPCNHTREELKETEEYKTLAAEYYRLIDMFLSAKGVWPEDSRGWGYPKYQELATKLTELEGEITAHEQLLQQMAEGTKLTHYPNLFLFAGTKFEDTFDILDANRFGSIFNDYGKISDTGRFGYTAFRKKVSDTTTTATPVAALANFNTPVANQDTNPLRAINGLLNLSDGQVGFLYKFDSATGATVIVPNVAGITQEETKKEVAKQITYVTVVGGLQHNYYLELLKASAVVRLLEQATQGNFFNNDEVTKLMTSFYGLDSQSTFNEVVQKLRLFNDLVYYVGQEYRGSEINEDNKYNGIRSLDHFLHELPRLVESDNKAKVKIDRLRKGLNVSAEEGTEGFKPQDVVNRMYKLLQTNPCLVFKPKICQKGAAEGTSSDNLDSCDNENSPCCRGIPVGSTGELQPFSIFKKDGTVSCKGDSANEITCSCKVEKGESCPSDKNIKIADFGDSGKICCGATKPTSSQVNDSDVDANDCGRCLDNLKKVCGAKKENESCSNVDSCKDNFIDVDSGSCDPLEARVDGLEWWNKTESGVTVAACSGSGCPHHNDFNPYLDLIGPYALPFVACQAGVAREGNTECIKYQCSEDNICCSWAADPEGCSNANTQNPNGYTSSEEGSSDTNYQTCKNFFEIKDLKKYTVAGTDKEAVPKVVVYKTQRKGFVPSIWDMTDVFNDIKTKTTPKQASTGSFQALVEAGLLLAQVISGGKGSSESSPLSRVKEIFVDMAAIQLDMLIDRYKTELLDGTLDQSGNLKVEKGLLVNPDGALFKQEGENNPLNLGFDLDTTKTSTGCYIPGPTTGDWKACADASQPVVVDCENIFNWIDNDNSKPSFNQLPLAVRIKCFSFKRLVKYIYDNKDKDSFKEVFKDVKTWLDAKSMAILWLLMKLETPLDAEVAKKRNAGGAPSDIANYIKSANSRFSDPNANVVNDTSIANSEVAELATSYVGHFYNFLYGGTKANESITAIDNVGSILLEKAIPEAIRRWFIYIPINYYLRKKMIGQVDYGKIDTNYIPKDLGEKLKVWVKTEIAPSASAQDLQEYIFIRYQESLKEAYNDLFRFPDPEKNEKDKDVTNWSSLSKNEVKVGSNNIPLFPTFRTDFSAHYQPAAVEVDNQRVVAKQDDALGGLLGLDPDKGQERIGSLLGGNIDEWVIKRVKALQAAQKLFEVMLIREIAGAADGTTDITDRKDDDENKACAEKWLTSTPSDEPGKKKLNAVKASAGLYTTLGIIKDDDPNANRNVCYLFGYNKNTFPSNRRDFIKPIIDQLNEENFCKKEVLDSLPSLMRNILLYGNLVVGGKTTKTTPGGTSENMVGICIVGQRIKADDVAEDAYKRLKWIFGNIYDAVMVKR